MEELIKTYFDENDYLTEYSIKYKVTGEIDNDRKIFIFKKGFDKIFKIIRELNIPEKIIEKIFRSSASIKQIILGCNKDNSIIKIYRFCNENNFGFTIEKGKITMKKYIPFSNKNEKGFIEEDVQKEISICKHQKVKIPYKNEMKIYYIGNEVNGDLTIYFSKPSKEFNRL